MIADDPLYTPEAARIDIPSAPPDQMDPEAWINQLHLLDPDGSMWEQSVYDGVRRHLPMWSKWTEVFPNLEKVQLEVSAIRVIWDEAKYKDFENIQGVHPAEPFLAFHGCDLKAFHPIMTDGFDPDRGNDCWYGKGVYLTTNLVYSQHYINFRGKNADNWLYLPKVGHTVYVLGVLLKPGKTLFVNDKTTFRDKPCSPGYTSHRVLAEPKKWSVGLVALPDDDESRAFADEWVIFDKQRALPRFIISLKRLPDLP